MLAAEHKKMLSMFVRFFSFSHSNTFCWLFGKSFLLLFLLLCRKKNSNHLIAFFYNFIIVWIALKWILIYNAFHLNADSFKINSSTIHEGRKSLNIFKPTKLRVRCKIAKLFCLQFLFINNKKNTLNSFFMLCILGLLFYIMNIKLMMTYSFSLVFESCKL